MVNGVYWLVYWAGFGQRATPGVSLVGKRGEQASWFWLSRTLIGKVEL